MVILNGTLQNGATAQLQAACFLDVRDNANPEPLATSAKWYPKLWNLQEFNRISSYVELVTHAITAADSTSNFFKVATDVTAQYPAGRWFDVRGSTGNDSGATPYVVTSSSFASGETTINVASVSDNTADGTISAGHIKFLSATNFVIRCTSGGYDTQGGNLRMAKIDSFTYTSGYVNAEGPTKTEGLASFYSSNGDDVSAQPSFVTQLSPSAGDIYEVQQYTQVGSGSTFAGGTDGRAARQTYGWIEIVL